jgi:hypothetical protein
MATNRKKHRAPVPVFQRDPGPWSRLLIDWLATLAVIMIFGLVMLFSASYTTGPAAGDAAASHGGWVEDQNYSQGTRPAASFAAASGGSKALASAAVFTLNAGTTIKGCFLASVSTKGGTTGIIYSAGLFSGGDKVMQSGDSLNVSYTASL